MRKVKCTIYDCELDLYHEAVIEDNVVFILDKEGNQSEAKEYILPYVDYGMVQFFIGDYDESVHEIENNNSKWGYFKLSTGEIIVPPVYDYAYPFYGDRAKVRRKMKYGFIDTEGNEVVKIDWDDTANSVGFGLCWVKKGDKYGYVDRQGVKVLTPQFEKAERLNSIGNEKYAAIVKKDGKYGFIDEKGNYIFEPVFQDAKKFWFADYKLNKVYAPVKAFYKWTFIDIKGKFVVNFQFDDIGEEKGITIKKSKEKKLCEDQYISFYTVRKDGKWGLMNADFELIMPEDEQSYVIYHDVKIYIKEGKVTSVRKLKDKKQ
ncbi:WG repeat-containing protein [Clostridium folliculivorans]|uniref:WG repeat-containing protein n=1 Tax=Clostridium folliculivorans TaxID=2886038 RepID=UPI0021C2F56A|nr:WG repeat-containing protein [Clostridium folliculivorans]GKU29298.1 hypothetical protein CFB3_14040 [Clostridium folliculivorans]